MGIHRDAVGAFPALKQRALLGEHGDAPAVRGIDVEPEVVPRADGRDRVEGIDGAGGGRPGRGHDRERADAASPILGDGIGERVGAHRQAVVHRDAPDALEPEAEHDGGLVDAGVGVLGAVHAERRRALHAAAARVGEHALPCGGERQEVAAGAAIRCDRGELVRQSEQLAHPVADRLLELDAGRARAPDHRVRIRRRREEVAQNARLRGAAREVREVARMRARRERRQECPLEVGEDLVVRGGLLRRLRRQSGTHVARSDRRGERDLALAIQKGVGDPVHHAVGAVAKSPGVVTHEKIMEEVGRKLARRPMRRTRAGTSDPVR